MCRHSSSCSPICNWMTRLQAPGHRFCVGFVCFQYGFISYGNSLETAEDLPAIISAP